MNLFVTTWESRAGRRLGSEVLVADARHTLSDVVVSSGVIVSLVLVKLGWRQADGIVALLVAVVIFRTAFGVIRGVARTLGDEARLPARGRGSRHRRSRGARLSHAAHARPRDPGQYCGPAHPCGPAEQTVEGGDSRSHTVSRGGPARALNAQVVDVPLTAPHRNRASADVTRTGVSARTGSWRAASCERSGSCLTDGSL